MDNNREVLWQDIVEAVLDAAVVAVVVVVAFVAVSL